MGLKFQKEKKTVKKADRGTESDIIIKCVAPCQQNLPARPLEIFFATSKQE